MDTNWIQNFPDNIGTCDSLSPDLQDWVAVKENVFESKFDELDGKHATFNVQWNKAAKEFDVTYKDTSKSNNSEVIAKFSSKDLKNIHKLVVLMYPKLNDCFPTIPSGSIFSGPKISEKICNELERYFQTVLLMCGRQLLMAVYFENPENDDYLCELYQESMSELKLKSLEEACEKCQSDLDEVLKMRERCDNMLQLSAIYPLEESSIVDLLHSLSLYYEFHIQPFIDLRKVSHEKLKAAKDETGEEFDKIKIREYQEQVMSADDSALSLRREHLNKRFNFLCDHLNRLLNDQKKFGKSAFEMYGLDLLHAYELNLTLEKLLYLKLCNEVLKHDALKIQHKMLIIPESQLKNEAKKIESETVENQIKLFDIKLDILNEKEVILHKKLIIVYKQINDKNAIVFFHDAVENIEDLPSDSENSIEKNENVIKFKQQLSEIYQARANLRNKKNFYISKHKRKQEIAEENLKLRETHHKVKMTTIEKRKHGSLSKEAFEMERQKTLERLKSYRMKFSTRKNKDDFNSQSGAKSLVLPPPPAEIDNTYGEDIQCLPLPAPPKFVLKKYQLKKKEKNKIALPSSTAHGSSENSKKSSQHPPSDFPVNSSASPIVSSNVPTPSPIAPTPVISSDVPIPPSLPIIRKNIPVPPPPPPPSDFTMDKIPLSSLSTSGEPPVAVSSPFAITPDMLKSLKLKTVEKKKPEHATGTGNRIQLSDILLAKKDLRKQNGNSTNMMQSVVDADLKVTSQSPGSHSTLLMAALSRIRNCNIENTSDDEDDENISDFE